MSNNSNTTHNNTVVFDNNTVMEHELEEWKYLNDYINKMDTGYMQGLSLLLAIVTGILTLVFSVTKPGPPLTYIFFLIPPVLTVVLAYIGYQFRITAILRGHLARIERSMNAKLGEEVHLWNSALVEVLMGHHNEINTFLMGPSLFAVAIIIILAGKYTWSICQTFSYGIITFCIYWIFEMVFAVVIIISFFRNNKVKYTADHKIGMVIDEYKDIQKKQEKKTNSIYDPNIANRTINSVKQTIDKLNSWISAHPAKTALIVLVCGFGMMNILWFVYFCTGKLHTTLPGLYDYYAATIGDGICLPLLFFFGLKYLREYTLDKQDIHISNLIGFGTFIIATIVQLSWVLNPDIGLNWTIPETHHFNLAGIYHAVFFVCMLSASAILCARVFLVHKQSTAIQAKNIINYTVFWSSISMFLYMHALDDYVERFGFWGAFSSVFLISIVTEFIFFLCSPQKDKRELFAMFCGNIIALGIACCIYHA